MAEQRPDTPRRYEETTHPRNPPNSVLHRGVRRAAIWSYFVPIVALFAIIGVGLIYWSNRSASSEAPLPEHQAVGTFGSDQGGFDPAPQPRSTASEVNRRGDDLEPITTLRGIANADVRTMIGRRVALTDVAVDSLSDDVLWMHDRERKIAILAPRGTASVKPGMKVSVTGRIESGDHGNVEVRADHLELK